MRDRSKYLTLLGLYVAQSVPMAFFTTVLPIIMRQEAYSLTSIGLLQLIRLPWVLKVLWAPIVDHHTRSMGSLRRWIVCSELTYALVLLCIGMLRLPTDFALVLLCIIASLIASATQDIAVDRYAIVSLESHERSLGNSMQTGGGFIGSLVGTGLLIVAYGRYGWSWVLIALSLLVAGAIVPLLLGRGRACSTPLRPYTDRVHLGDLIGFVREVRPRGHLLLVPLYLAGIVGITAMMKPYLVDLGYSVEAIATMLGVGGASVAVVSALLAGIVMRHVGRIRSLASFLLLGVGAAIYMTWIGAHTPSQPMLWVGIVLVWAAQGMASVGLFTLAMDRVRQGREGTDFTLQTVVSQLGSLVVVALGGSCADRWGYQVLFAVEALLGMLALATLLAVGRRQEV